jgi:transcriptional regulator EpsA
MTINSLKITNDQLTVSDCLNAEQLVVFMDVISDSLRITQKTQLFNWLQGGFQYLLGHELIVYGIKSAESDTYRFEYFTSTRYFTEDQFNAIIQPDTGLISQVLKVRQKIDFPIFVTNTAAPSEQKNHSVINVDEAQLKDSELKYFVLHGFGDSQNKMSSVVLFARLHKEPSINHAHILELIMPHLHCALVRVSSSKNNAVVSASKENSILTKRELEILQWLHMGKTNWEISSILEISPLTVKNHVQNILRKFDVQNRSQAVVRAVKLGLIDDKA